MKYALLDWDNTLRRGFTLFTWIDYLLDKGYISPSVRNDIMPFIEMEDSGLISHSELAKRASKIYAEGIRGLTYVEYEKCLVEYMETDESYIFNFVSDLFAILSKNNIDAIIISGSPELIIRRYAKRFNISKIYAMLEEKTNGVFNGSVSQNFGYNKKRIIDKLFKLYGEHPFLSIGDSCADLAMLEVAKCGFWVKKDNNKIMDSRFKTLDPNSDQILIELESMLTSPSLHAGLQ